MRAGVSVSGELTLGMLAIAGLADGINPCAFAAIAFLVSCLAVLHVRSRFYMLGCGLLFCLGLFLFYYTLGLGFLQFAAMFRERKGVPRLLFRASAAVCCVFSVLGIGCRRGLF